MKPKPKPRAPKIQTHPISAVRQALANPVDLAPQDSGDLLNVIIETPKGSRNKYAFDEKLRIYTLSKVLPEGMSFPFDFGFVPRTRAEDGDPLDVLVLMDEPAFPGCLVQCRLLGVIAGEQKEQGKFVRNDRLLAVEHSNHSYADVRRLSDLPRPMLRQISEFFVNYHRLLHGEFRVLGIRGVRAARQSLAVQRRAA